MYSQEDLCGLAALMSVSRVIMQDMGAASSDVIEMERELLNSFGVADDSQQGRAVIAWSYLHPEKSYEELTN